MEVIIDPVLSGQIPELDQSIHCGQVPMVAQIIVFPVVILQNLLNEIRRLKLLYKQSKILLSGQSQRKERMKNGFVKMRSAGIGA